MEWKNLDELNSYKLLIDYKNKINLKNILNNESGVQRVKKYQSDMSCGLKYVYAAKEIDDNIIDLLSNLAIENNSVAKYKLLLNGEFINTGENRRVLHHLCRGQLGEDVIDNNINMREFYNNELDKIKNFSEKIRSGSICNEKNEKYTTVVQIGIGGSDLGPRAMYIALENYGKRTNKLKLDAKFISNVDPDDALSILSNIDISKTIFVLVSKSGTTLETLTNEAIVKEKIIKNNLQVNKHMVAVTSKTSPIANSSEYMEAFFIDDYIGGRYSSTSAVGGVVLSIALGFDVFEEFLDGAHSEDKNSLNEDIRKNPALLDALIGVYERNILGYEITAVLPYSNALSRFPAHLQQVDMESNGKSVNRFGDKINYKTGPIIFGEPGTNGQHSFYQLLHQGKTIVPIQFIGFKKNQFDEDVEIKGSSSQTKLCANLVSQVVAFALGSENKDNNKNFDGNRPSSLIVGEELNPKSLGALLSHFENKIMFQGFLWNINSFDQEGVQLGKVLAKKVLEKQSSGILVEYAKLFNI